MIVSVELARTELGADYAAIHARFQQLCEMARAEWVRLAQTELQATSADYIRGITPVEHLPGNWAQIRLVGWLPNALENGAPPFDMKPGLLAGKHAKVSKTGARYNIVPFRHGTPGTMGRNVGFPMPITSVSKAGKPGSLVYKSAKGLKASTELPGGKTSWAGKTGSFGGLGRRSMLPVEGGRPAAYTWKHSPYESMYKIAKTYAKATQAKYMTFRAVSSNSDSNSWWHPGFSAKHFAQRVADFLKEESVKAY